MNINTSKYSEKSVLSDFVWVFSDFVWVLSDFVWVLSDFGESFNLLMVCLLLMFLLLTAPSLWGHFSTDNQCPGRTATFWCEDYSSSSHQDLSLWVLRSTRHIHHGILHHSWKGCRSGCSPTGGYIHFLPTLHRWSTRQQRGTNRGKTISLIHLFYPLTFTSYQLFIADQQGIKDNTIKGIPIEVKLYISFIFSIVSFVLMKVISGFLNFSSYWM